MKRVGFNLIRIVSVVIYWENILCFIFEVKLATMGLSCCFPVKEGAKSLALHSLCFMMVERSGVAVSSAAMILAIF